MKQELTPDGIIIKGYKATDKNLCCKEFQFKKGKWFEYEGEIELCKSGFHFCEYPSGPWDYYNDGIIWEVEAQNVLLSNKINNPGVGLKHVCKKIRLIKKIKTNKKHNTGYYNTGNWNTGDRNTGYSNTGDRNTGNRNTGDRNTGDRNTGNRNTGDWNTGNWNTGYRNTGDNNTGNRNTGDRNTGDWNTGNWNTGDRNTGDRNTGNWNTGYSNTGDMNTGYRNTGDRNTGYYNTGNWNTGDWNTGNWNTGDRNTGDRNTGNWNTGYGNACDGTKNFFCSQERNPIIFDNETTDEIDFNLVTELSIKLSVDMPFDITPFLSLPNATEEKIKNLHKLHIERRKYFKEHSNFPE